MRNQQYKYFNLPNLGYILYKLSDKDIAYLQKAADNIQQDFSTCIPANKDLAGNIEHEYDLFSSTNKYLEEIVIPLGFEYLMHSNPQSIAIRHDGIHSERLILQKSWINFQKKYEFNPAHIHSGLLSFVIWLKVPFLSAEEIENSSRIPSNKNYAGCFEFTYTDATGSIVNNIIPVDKTYEGTLCMFSSKIKHAVYPFFTSDEYRISISGNISYAG